MPCAWVFISKRLYPEKDTATDAYSNLQSYHWAVIDAIIAAQNACVAAEALGLGI